MSTCLAGYALDAEIDLNLHMNNLMLLSTAFLENLASISCIGNEQSIRDCSVTTSFDFRNSIGIPAGVQCIGKNNNYKYSCLNIYNHDAN